VSRQCENCENYVTDDYARVLCPDPDRVRACPECEDRVRRKGRAVEARSTAGTQGSRSMSMDTSTYEREGGE
jgi:uncharacterized protein YlaI